jgi:hypothetical protein
LSPSRSPDRTTLKISWWIMKHSEFESMSCNKNTHLKSWSLSFDFDPEEKKTCEWWESENLSGRSEVEDKSGGFSICRLVCYTENPCDVKVMDCI